MVYKDYDDSVKFDRMVNVSDKCFQIIGSLFSIFNSLSCYSFAIVATLGGLGLLFLRANDTNTYGY